MTKDERLAETERNTKEELARTRRKLLQIQAARAAERQKALAARRLQVGTLADAAGLLQWSDMELAGLFAGLAQLAGCPNPVAVLEGLLQDAAFHAREAGLGFGGG